MQKVRSTYAPEKDVLTSTREEDYVEDMVQKLRNIYAKKKVVPISSREEDCV